uniref:Uncharacterized protein n=1 Tax=Meloidogyne javanica TaxID=6303 RepID=A0A915LFQ3_MELJA
MQSLYVRNCIMHVMVIERIIATLKSRNYEKHTSILFHVVWITITFLIALLNVLSALMLDYILVAILTYSSLSVLGILEIWALFWILNYNKRKYERKLPEGCHNLSERYQISENIRTAKQLLPCIIMHLMNIIVPGINVFFINFNVYSGQFNQDFVEEFITVVPGDDNDGDTSEYRNVIKLQPMDIHGRPLISNKKGDEFAKEYFKQLTISWQ